jgi:anti-sigma B factor antagonist
VIDDIAPTNEQNGAMVQRVTIAENADGTLALGGELDAYTAATVERALEALPPTGDAEVDVSAVAFVDSAVLRVFVRQSERLAAHGSHLRLVKPSPALQRLIELSGLESAFVLDSGDPDGGDQ